MRCHIDGTTVRTAKARSSGPTTLRCRGAYINERCHTLVGAGCRDDGATIRMTDENNKAAGASERCPHCGRVVSNGVEMVLRLDHLKAIGQEQRNDLAVT